MRNFGYDYFSFGPGFGRGFEPHFGPPRHGFEDSCGPWHMRGPRHWGPDSGDFGYCGRSHGPRGLFGPEHGPHRRPHFGPEGDGEFEFGRCGRGHGPSRRSFEPGHHRRPHFGPERDSDGEGVPSDFEHCGRRHGPHRGPFGPGHAFHRRPNFGKGEDEFDCRPCGHKHGSPRGPFGGEHGPHKRPHFGPERDSDAEYGPDFGPHHHHRPSHGPGPFGSYSRPGPYERPGRSGRCSPPPCCKRVNWESGCWKDKSQNVDVEESGNEIEGRGKCRKQNRSCCSKNIDGNEGNDTVLIQRIVVERVPRSNSV